MANDVSSGSHAIVAIITLACPAAEATPSGFRRASAPGMTPVESVYARRIIGV
jgi:hypothetical protein